MIDTEQWKEDVDNADTIEKLMDLLDEHSNDQKDISDCLDYLHCRMTEIMLEEEIKKYPQMPCMEISLGLFCLDRYPKILNYGYDRYEPNELQYES